MFSNIRRRFSYANVAMTLALVFAMSGGAYAANKYLITSTKQISPKVLKALKGQKGANGTSGAAGPAGPQGAQGSQGPQGPAGAAGNEGPAGKEGPTGKNGANGTNGKDGSPWTAGGTLPSGKTETGVWGIAAIPGVIVKGLIEVAMSPISFTIPLQEGLTIGKAHVIAAGSNGAGGGTCPTTSSVAKPEAEAGNLCIFQSTNQANVGKIEVLSPEEGAPEAGTTGVLVNVQPATAEKTILVNGTWAVTAE